MTLSMKKRIEGKPTKREEIAFLAGRILAEKRAAQTK